jgi:hypothetical protein
MGLFGNAPMGGAATTGPAPPAGAAEPAHPRWRAGLAAALASWGLYFAVLWPRMFFERADGLWAGWRTLWADWVAHLAYANVFAERPFGRWLESHPLFATQRFDYPFLADALSGLLMRAGLDRVGAFVWPSLLASLLLVALLYAFYARLLHTPRRALLATTLFFTNGGLGFLLFASDLARGPSWDMLAVPPREYTWLEPKHIEWINIVTSELLPQRGLLLGLPIGLAVLLMLLRYRASGFASATPAKLAALGLLASVLVVTHAHSFLALAWLCAWLFLFDLRHFRPWLGFAVATAVPSLALVALSYHDVGARGFFAWYPGWLANPAGPHPIPFWLFLWLNWGVFLPLAAVSILRLGGLRQPLWLAGATLFLAAMLFRFQPHPWDNTKLLTWAHLLLCAPVALYLARLWSRPGTLGRQLAVALFCFTTASGFLDVWRLLGGEAVSARMWSREELELADAFRRLSPPDALVLASDDHHHWVHALSGRRVLLGYRGWLASYGIDYAAVERDVQTMLQSGDPALLERYGVEFVVIGRSERRDFGARASAFEEHHTLVLEEADTKVFEVRRP